MSPRGFYTLFAKEVWRFLKVAIQTIFTPVVTAVLYLMVFSQVLQDRVQVYAGVSYLAFLVPGLIMMSIIQNAFANSSSSLIQSKMNGSLLFMLLAPLSNAEFYIAYTAAAVVRGLMVGGVLYLISLPFVVLPLAHPGVLVGFAVLGSAVLGAMGILAGVWADKYDQLSAFQNFFILPLSFLSGVFYSIHSLPPFWRAVSHLNPFFYMIDGFRYGFFGASDVDPRLSLWVTGMFFALISAICLFLLHKGYKLRG